VALIQNDWDAVYALIGEIRPIAALLKDYELMAWSLGVEALPLFMSGQAAEAIERGESAVSLARMMQNWPLAMAVSVPCCAVLVPAGQLDRTVELVEPALAEARERGEMWARGYLLNSLCQARWRQGDTELAEAMAHEAAACKHAVLDQSGLQAVLETLAWMTAGRGAHDHATMLLGCAEQVRKASGIPFQELHQRQQHDESVALTTRALGQDAFDAAYQRGLAMTVENALGLATTGSHRQPPKPTSASRGTASPLTQRELEIAGLIADELSNRDIATRLFLSQRTVEAHVTHIFNKLGVNSRTQLTRWLADTVRGASAEP
jgi:non-specific serine/threonine protein kinase